VGQPAAKELSRITDDRHPIVHEGKKPYVRGHPAEEATNLVAGIAGCIDDAVCKLY
jgi:hypothetical protein